MIKRSIFQVWSFDVIAKIALALTEPLIIRVLIPDEYAKYSLAFALIVTVQVISIGFNRTYVLEHDNLNLKKYSLTYFGLQLTVLTALTLLSAPISATLGVLFPITYLYLVVSFSTEFLKTIYQQQLNFFRFSILEVSGSILYLIGVWLIFHRPHSVGMAWQVIGLRAVVAMLIFMIVVFKSINIQSLRKIFNYADFAIIINSLVKNNYLYLFIFFMLAAVASQIDIFLLRRMSSSLELATYGASFRYFSFIQLPIGAINTVLLPTLQRMNNRAEMNKALSNHQMYLPLYCVIVLVGAWLAKWIIPWIDQGKYPGSVLAFRVMSVLAVIAFIGVPWLTVLLKRKDFKFLFKLTAVGIGLNLAVSTLLIPHMGAIGSAIGTLVAFGTVYLAYLGRARLILNKVVATN